MSPHLLVLTNAFTLLLSQSPSLTHLLPQQTHARLQPAPTVLPPPSPASSARQTPACRPREEGTVSTPKRPAPSHAPRSESLKYIPSPLCLVLASTCPIPARLSQSQLIPVPSHLTPVPVYQSQHTFNHPTLHQSHPSLTQSHLSLHQLLHSSTQPHSSLH